MKLPFWVDALRWFEVMQASLLSMLIVGTIVYYLFTFPPHLRRLLRFHVIFISLSYLAAILFMMVELLERMNTPLTWRGVAATWTFSSGLAAMILLIVHLTVVKNGRKP